MLRKVVLVTDSCCDLPLKIVNDYEINVIPMHFAFSGISYLDTPTHKEMSVSDFYLKLRNKEVAITSQATIEDCLNVIKPLANEGYDIICLGFSSALSGTVNSMRLVSDMIKDEFPNINISVIDTLSASLGEGLYVYLVAKKIKEGYDFQKVLDYALSLQNKICHYFTVDDLGTLKRGGRLSASKAFLGSLLNLKPILHVTTEGKLVPIAKKIGRKQSLNMLFDFFKQKCSDPSIIFISHGSCYSDAEYVKNKIIDIYPNINDVVIGDIGPVIGAHSGPGTVAIFFLGEER